MTPKYHTRSVIITTEASRATALALVTHAPIGIEIVVREAVKARGLDANGLYWLRLGEISEQAWLNGRQFTADIWHEHCRREVMPDTITKKDGEDRSKWVEMPHGLPMVISTTQLERKCFSEYISMVEAFGASLGVRFSANPRGEK
jgi:NinB protein